VATDWCTDGMPALSDDVCYVLPEGASGPPKALLVYLHGIVPPVPDSPQKRTVQGAVLAASTRAGVAALVPRGRRGIGPGRERDWWAWPTTAEAHAQLTAGIVARWADAKRALEQLAGAPFERTYLAGSSNGAYYVTALALRGDVPAAGFPVDGFGAMSGGAASSAPAARIEARPFYVGFGAYDAESATRARSLAALLGAAHWPVRLAEHPFGHGAHEVYLDEAFAFWEGSAAAPP
jgi:predicted esterase